MHSKIIEATNVDAGGLNYGKFMVARFTSEEWAYKSIVDEGAGLISARGWGPSHVWVMDLQTGEGALFAHGGVAKYDLDKHKIWVCPLFEPFLKWLYTQDVSDLDALPAVVAIDDPNWALYGYRRPGPDAFST